MPDTFIEVLLTAGYLMNCRVEYWDVLSSKIGEDESITIECVSGAETVINCKYIASISMITPETIAWNKAQDQQEELNKIIGD